MYNKTLKHIGENMNLKQAKEYFDDGVIAGFTAVRDPLAVDCWNLIIIAKSGRSWTFQTALGEVRAFSKLDTLVGQVELICGDVSSVELKF